MTNKNVHPDFEQRVKDIIGEIKGYGFGMLNDMIDPTEFFVNYIENYESLS